jgi:DNA-3-methyladenine glycosylase
LKISQDYFENKDVLFLAEDLLGKYIFTLFDGQITGGIITETEAYRGITDRASHAFNGRRTKRNEAMYARGGILYVYLCYGIHHLSNIVTIRGVPEAILSASIVQPTVKSDSQTKRKK